MNKSNIKIFIFLLLIVAFILAIFTFKDTFKGFSKTDDVNEASTQKKEYSKNLDSKPEPKIEYEEYTGDVPHIFIHALIAYPEVKGVNGRMNYDYECINVTEFKNMLRELYANGYCLIDIHDTFETDENGGVAFKETLQVPVGRKPIIVTVDDVVYDYSKRNRGMVDFLDIDKNNNIVTGTYKDDGSVYYSDDNEFVPILEDFIKEHPDFSANGSRFTLAMTGFAGTFGYRTDADFGKNGGDRDGEIAKAKKIADRLKEMGYTFASHSYGHGRMPDHSYNTMKADLQAFRDEVEPVIGPVSVFVYPYGKLLDPTDPKYKLAQSYDFKLFCSVADFFFQRNYSDKSSIYMTRVAVDGYSLRQYGAVLAPLFDVNKVMDHENRQ